MIGQLISISFVLVVLAANSESIRRHRRQAIPVSNVVTCPVQCSWSFSQAWTKAISFDTPTSNMIDDQLVTTNNGTFGLMCSLYSAYQGCLKACVATNDEYANAVNASPSYEEMCTDRQGEFDSYAPCLANHTPSYQKICQNANEDLLAAGVRLTTNTFTSTTAREFCKAANDQAFCILPVLRQTCGDGPYDALRSIVNASLAGLRVSVGDEAVRTSFPECYGYFKTIENGIPITVAIRNETRMSSTDTTPILLQRNSTMNSTNETTTSWLSILRDDPVNGTSDEENPSGGRLFASGSPRYRTTTESHSGTANHFHNKFLFFFCSIIFCILLQ